MADITLTQAKNSLARLKQDISDVPQATFIEWGNFGNRQFYDFINGIDPERFVNQATTFTVSAAPQTSSLPSDFMNIQPLGCGFFRIDDNGDDTDNRLVRTNFGSRTQGYYIQGTNVVFTGTDDNTKYRLRFIPILTTLTALSQTIILDEIYLQHFVLDLNTLYEQWDQDPGAESLADFRFVRSLEALGNNIKKEPGAYAIPDFANNF